MIEASMRSLKCQLYRSGFYNKDLNNSNDKDNLQIREKDKSISNNAWQYTPFYRRKIPFTNLPIENIDSEINRIKYELISNLKSNIKIIKNNKKNIDEHKIIKEIKNLPIVIMPSDKTKKLIAMESEKYDNFKEEHLINYTKINYIKLPKTEQLIFNKDLEEIAIKYNEPIKSLLLSTKCNEPIPSSMYFVPKDHKDIIKGRPIVSASDTPSTSLCKLLGDLIKPLLDFIPAHLKDSNEFVKRIRNYQWNKDDNFGSLDVQNLYGSIPIEGNDNVIDIVGNFFSQYKIHTEAKDITDCDFQSLLKLCIFSDKILINNILYKQKSGLAMGNNLSPILAIIYMHHIEQQIIKSSDNQIKLWLRYIDDIFFVTKLPNNNILTISNKINNNIQFTLEEPINNKMPFLDVLIENDFGNISTSLYVKPFHSQHIMPWCSNISTKQKIGVIKNERIRAERLSSDNNNKNISLKKIKDKFLLNGYPYKIIMKYLYENNDKKNNSNKIDSIIKLPFINEKSCQKMQYILRKSKLKFNPRIIFKNEAPISTSLQKSRKPNCGTNCICDDTSLCNKKNVVYKITCTDCEATYIGETYRTIRTRIKEHLKQKESEVFKHFINFHNKTPTLNKINWKILGSNYVSSLHRKEHEKILIQNQNPIINIVHNVSNN